MKQHLYCLAVSIWNADDYLSDRNTNPMHTDLYLYTNIDEAKRMAKNLYADKDIYNEGYLCEMCVPEETILELSGYESIDDFIEAVSSAEYDKHGALGYGDNELGKVAEYVICNGNESCPVECNNYEYKNLSGAVVVCWRWMTYIGYCREILEIRDATTDETEEILIPVDRTYEPQFSVLVTSEERDGLDAEALKDLIEERLSERHWKWRNGCSRFIDEYIERIS